MSEPPDPEFLKELANQKRFPELSEILSEESNDDLSSDKRNLKNLIENLQLALKNGFDSRSQSSARILLDAMADLSQTLGRELGEISPHLERINQDVKELPYADAIGNAKMVKVGDKILQPLHDDIASTFFARRFPAFLIELKSGKSFFQSMIRLMMCDDHWWNQLVLQEWNKKDSKTRNGPLNLTPQLQSEASMTSFVLEASLRDQTIKIRREKRIASNEAKNRRTLEKIKESMTSKRIGQDAQSQPK